MAKAIAGLEMWIVNPYPGAVVVEGGGVHEDDYNPKGEAFSAPRVAPDSRIRMEVRMVFIPNKISLITFVVLDRDASHPPTFRQA